MNSTEYVQRMAKTLDISYMLVGSFSTNLYSIPRSTKDADFVVHFVPGQIGQLRASLAPEFVLEPQTQFETVTGTYKNVVHIVNSEFEIELFRLSQDAHDQSRFQRRLRNEAMGFAVWIPTVEDVVVTKLRWTVAAGRGKDRDDVKEVIGVQRGQLDWAYIHHWTAVHGTRLCLDEIVRSIPADLLVSGIYPFDV